ncbi:MAG: eL32 family ribosomal protein [Candidatus ainarchaeum sp.]|nr:eL32 family ribosomal protein [Candidatus ainarchaeum sp.]
MVNTKKTITKTKDKTKKIKKKEDIKVGKKETTNKKENEIKSKEEKIKVNEEKNIKKENKNKEAKEIKTKEEVVKKKEKKYIQEEKKENKNKSKEAKEAQKKLEIKKKHPVFRGRFGKKNIRRKSIKKWQKWRKPRSIDLDRGLQHGYRPKIGYRNDKKIRDIHPSGYKEIRVENLKELEKVNVKENAIRIGATVGKRKRNEIIKKANEKGIWVLN